MWPPLHFPSHSPSSKSPRPLNFIAGVGGIRRHLSSIPATVGRLCRPFCSLSLSLSLAHPLSPLSDFSRICRVRNELTGVASPSPPQIGTARATEAFPVHAVVIIGLAVSRGASPCPLRLRGAPRSAAALIVRNSSRRVTILQQPNLSEPPSLCRLFPAVGSGSCDPDLK